MELKIFSIFILLSFIFSFTLASDTLKVPTLLPSSVTTYDIEDGLRLSCLGKVIADSKGRLWLNPCILDRHQVQGFFQFDGNQSYTIPMMPEGEEENFPFWDLRGITPGELLFGTNLLNTHSFLFDPDTRDRHVFSFEGGEEIANIMAGAGREVYVLTESPEAYALYKITREEKKLLARIDIAPDKSRYFGREIPAVYSGNTICFLHQNKGFFRYSLADHTYKQFDWKALMGDTLKGYPVFKEGVTNLAMSPDHRGNLLFYISDLRGLFVFAVESGTLTRQGQVEDFFEPRQIPDNRWAFFNQDEQGNTLLTLYWDPRETGNEAFPCMSLLLDSEGQLFDYTPVARMAMAGRYGIVPCNYFYSRHFKKNVLIATPGGLIAVGIKANLPIVKKFTGWPTRGIGPMGHDCVLVISESGPRGILDLGKMEGIELPENQTHAPFFSIRSFAQLVERNGEELWFPTEDKQLGCYQYKNGTFRFYKVGQAFNKFNFLSAREAVLVNEKHELYRYDPEREKLDFFGEGEGPLNLNGIVNELYVSKDSIIWAATLNGLWRLDPRTGQGSRLGKENGFQDDQIMCIHEATDGSLWLGTMEAGVHIYDPATGSVKVVDQNSGLSNNTVVGILSDQEGDCWVSTFAGITVLSPQGEVLFELSEQEGLSHREFNRYSYLKTADGHLIFGGVAGISVLNPEKIKREFSQNEALRIYLTTLSYYDKAQKTDIRLTTGLDQIRRIQLPATHRYIELDFGLSDYLAPDQNQFSYRIERNRDWKAAESGTEKWTSIGSDSKLVLNDLLVGDYTLLVRGINAKGQWTEQPIAIPIRVNEFFYKTWWFYLLSTLPFALGAYFWIMRLITEKERLETEVASRTKQIQQDKALIEEQAAKLQELDEAKSRFFTNISHELRTPLTIIGGMAEQALQELQAQYPEVGEKVIQKLEMIQRNNGSLLYLVKQILDLRKLEAGKLSLDLIQGEIVAYLKYILESFHSWAEEKDLSMHFLAGSPEIHMDYDPEKVMRIIYNLLANAIKFTEKGGEITLKVEQLREDQIRISLQDTGIGIPQEMLPHIFDQFYQVDSSITRKGEGTGIGLAIVHKYVDLMGGEVEVESEPGQGTLFVIQLPIHHQSPERREEDLPLVPEMKGYANGSLPELSQPTAPGDLPHLLIVEDNPDIVRYVHSFLQDRYQISVAQNGQEGIDKATEEIPDIIISDLMMPEKDGYELTQTLKSDQRTSHIPIILLTAKADEDSRLQGLERGADVYLVKPFRQRELEIHLDKLLRLRETLRARYSGDNITQLLPSEDPGVRQEDAFITELRKAVEENLDVSPFGVPELCAYMGMSKSQLHRKITALTGRSTSIFMRFIRLEKSKELMRNTRSNISEIAYEVGFSDVAYFSRCFSGEYGISPSTFVDQLHAQQKAGPPPAGGDPTQ